MRNVLLAAIALGLCGCGPGYTPLMNYKASSQAYRECIQAKGADACSREKALLEADAHTYETIAGQYRYAGNPAASVSATGAAVWAASQPQPARTPVTCTTTGAITNCY